MSNVNIFLIGKTGNGKSSTGNSLLGREAFVTSDSSDSVTSIVQTSSGRLNDMNIRIVDGPGLGDTRMDSVDAIRAACSDLETGLTQCPDGMHAFLLVLKYGNRFTAEEQATVTALRDILGERALADFGIVVFTHGEIFDMNNQNSGVSFAQWRQQQTGGLKACMDECGNRCVLVYNASPEKMAAQIDTLMSHVTSIQNNAGSYTHGMFLAQSYRQEQLIVQANAPQIRLHIESSTQSLRQRLNDIQSLSSGFDDRLDKLLTLGGEVRQLKNRVVDEDKGTGVLHSQQQTISALEDAVCSQEKVVRDQKSADEHRKEAERIEAQRLANEAAAAASRPRSPDPVQKVVREVERSFKKVGKLFRF